MSMCYRNHPTDSSKDIWSDLYLLAETAIKVDEEEKREEESKKRVFCLYPRKIRSSLVKKRRDTQQNLKAVSTSSSSSLLDLNLMPTDDNETENLQNPSSDEPMVCDEEQSRKKGKPKIVCEEEECDEKRLFEKNLEKFATRSRRYTQQNYENLNEASTSSSLLNLRCFEPSLILYYNTAEPEKTEMKDPPNPNYHSSSPSLCLTKNTSRKRRAVQQRKRTGGGFKKAKISPPLPRRVTETPEWIFRVIRYMNSDDVIPRLIFERILTPSDVNPGQSRLLIPFKKLIRNDFLTRAEYLAVQNEEEDEENIGVGTILVNQRCEMWGLRFKIWAMEKESGNGTMNYILNWGWNDVVKGNDLKVDDKISLWTFRCRGVLCFAMDTE